MKTDVDGCNNLKEMTDAESGGAIDVVDMSEVFEEKLRKLYVDAGITIPRYISKRLKKTIGKAPDADRQEQEEDKYYRVSFLTSTAKLKLDFGAKPSEEELKELQKELAEGLAFKLFEIATLREPVGFLLKCGVIETSPDITGRNFIAFTYPAFRMRDYDVIQDDTKDERLSDSTQEYVDKINAFDTVAKALKNDPDLRFSWHANISMAFQDEYSLMKGLTKKGLREMANNAADRFLDNFTRNVE